MDEYQPNYTYDSYVGIKFVFTTHSYFFGVKNLPLNIGDKVVVETTHGPELGEVVIEPKSIEDYHSELELKPVLRKATDVDLKLHEYKRCANCTRNLQKRSNFSKFKYASYLL